MPEHYGPRRALALVLVLGAQLVPAQTGRLADSLRRAYEIPELAYAVVSSDSVLEMHVLGIRKWGTDHMAGPDNRFRIGSNTKAITGFIAARLVKEGTLSWDTRFFDLYPELKEQSHRAYHDLTLLDLLTFRTRLLKWTYTDSVPSTTEITGDDGAQRIAFMAWCLRQPPVPETSGPSFSNPAYVAAGLMLEKATGRPYKELVGDLGAELDINFAFGAPNSTDSLQPWGHDKDLRPEPPGMNNKLEWLLAAGNIQLSVPGFAKFIRLQLAGAAGRSPGMSAEEFRFLHQGRERFAIGWFWEKEPTGDVVIYNFGNPGTFLSKVFMLPEKDRAFILVCNAQSTGAEEGLDVLYTELRRRYAH
jgi:CubicO group peptidase (beta-lactamase class C family)